MRMDLDGFLLNRLFQPITDRSAEWITCFGLARLSLAGAVILQMLILAVDLRSASDPIQKVATGSVTWLALFGAQQAWSLIARTERQARPGAVNLRQITLRWQRLAWLAVTAWSVATGISAGGEIGLELSGVGFAWLSLIYFVSCTPPPPPQRSVSRQAFA